MPYDSNLYTSKNIYLPKELNTQAERRAKELYMNFSAYVRHLLVKDLTKPNSNIQ